MTPEDHRRFFLDGRWVRPTSDRELTVVNPATERPLARIGAGGAADVDAAVRAASARWPMWRATPLEERLQALARLRALLERECEPLARTVTAEMGAPLTQAVDEQVRGAVRMLETVLEGAEQALAPERVGATTVVREPVGPVACITPWNFPVSTLLLKIAAALAAGCSVVAKPSELAPLSAMQLADLAAEAGLPDGVLNLVTGDGETGQLLVRHPLVRAVSFTGSNAAGRQIAAVAGDGLKRVVLELGGKSASVLVDGGTLERATVGTVKNCFFNSGQVCDALTRFLVPRDLQTEVAALAAGLARQERVGDPADAATTMGPLVSERQRDAVVERIDDALARGVSRATDGDEELPQQGWFVRPTVFVDVDPGDPVALEEIFGPVLAIIPYDSTEQAVEIANATRYGLAARIWADDLDAAMRLAGRLEAGQVAINEAMPDVAAPFGGFKESGIGRENGAAGVAAFTEVKAIASDAAR
jgi:acyl-CoA reductase-like NAD-dependent aldehyde dehydrogenase